MNDQPNITDDVEGHGTNRPFADDSDHDFKGYKGPYTEESDDVEGHAPRVRFGAEESAEGDTDTQGHGLSSDRADAESAEGDDVEGHVYVQTPDDINGERMR